MSLHGSHRIDGVVVSLILSIIQIMILFEVPSSAWMIAERKQYGSRMSSLLFSSSVNDKHMMMKGIATMGLTQIEIDTWMDKSKKEMKVSSQVHWDDIQILQKNDDDDDDDNNNDKAILATRGILGATGRVLLLQPLSDDNVSFDDDDDDKWYGSMTNEIDHHVMQGIWQRDDHTKYEQFFLSQPLILSIEREIPSKSDLPTYMKNLVARTVQEYEMMIPLPKSESNSPPNHDCITPTLQMEVDGAVVISSNGEKFWDTSSILVFDNLISEELRSKLLDVVLGREDYDDRWDCTRDGPDPRRWIRGGLMDTTEEKNDENEEDNTTTTHHPCWGLSEDAIEDLCFSHHEAVEEFEIILSQLFSNFIVSRLPEVMFGEDITPLTANAPTHGDTFSYHIDGDPNLTPPSPWTDVYGRYPNRQRGKPRLISCLVYLNEEWRKEWGAPTRFIDVATDTTQDIQPIPGRIVIMDQDITHTVVAPTEAAGKRPRYSLVWKLVLHPKHHNQDMSLHQQGWPEPALLGSAALKPNGM
jgi:2OG-Fe(II) oxygenase superfamily